MPKARAARRARYMRAFAITAGLVLAPVLSGSSAASAQGLFEALFGRSAFAPAPQIYAPGPATLPGYDASGRYRPPTRYTPKRITREARASSTRRRQASALCRAARDAGSAWTLPA